MKKKYTEKHINYLREISPGRYSNEIVKMFNQKFGMNVTESAILSLKTRYGIRSDVPKVRRQYTDEQINYLKGLSAQGLFNAEITRFFNEKFGTNKTENAIQQQRLKYGFPTTARYYWKKGNTPWNKGKKGWCAEGCKPTQFKKNNRPLNWVPVGSETVDRDGYLKTKIADPHKWKYKHRLIWEKHHGRPVPPNHVIMFGDGNRRNFDPENLILVSRAQLARMNQSGLIKNDANLTKTGAIIADLLNKIGERKKQRAEVKP